jgi:hypothetical protein
MKRATAAPDFHNTLFTSDFKHSSCGILDTYFSQNVHLIILAHTLNMYSNINYKKTSEMPVEISVGNYRN